MLAALGSSNSYIKLHSSIYLPVSSQNCLLGYKWLYPQQFIIYGAQSTPSCGIINSLNILYPITYMGMGVMYVYIILLYVIVPVLLIHRDTYS